MSKLIALAALLLVIGASLALPGPNSGQAKAAITAGSPEATLVSFQGRVNSVDLNREVVTVRWRGYRSLGIGKYGVWNRQSFHLRTGTEILFKGDSLRPVDLKPGSLVRVTGLREGANRIIASRIEVLREPGLTMSVSSLPTSIPGTGVNSWNY